MKKYLSKFLSSASTLLFLAPSLVMAQASYYTNPMPSITSIPCLLLALVDLIFLIGVPIIVMFIIYSGFLFVTAGDNEAQIAKARTSFKWTMLGALILLGAKAIALVVGTTILGLGGNGVVLVTC